MRWFWLFVCVLVAACGKAPNTGERDGVRVATTSPAVGVMLRDFGAAHLAVGRSGYDVALDPALPVIGDAAGLDLERLGTLGATHVFVETGDNAPPAGLEAMARRVGFEVACFELTNLRQLVDLAERVHGVVSTETDAGTSPRERFAQALAHDASLAGAGRVLLLMPGTPPAALGPGSVHHDVLVSMGGVPAIETGRPYMPLDAEDLLALSPDAVVLLVPGDDRPLEALLGRLASLPVPAFADGRVALLRDPEVLMASTSTIRYADDLRGWLEAWARGR